MRRLNSAPDIDRFRSILKTKGLKATPQRLAVHEAMLAMGHASADMVREWILGKGKVAITVASVYNILSQLTAMGLYRIIPSTGGVVWYDSLTKPHLHVYNRKKNEFKDLEDDEFMSRLQAYFKENPPKGYKVDEIDVLLTCHRSRNTKNSRI